MTVWSPADRAGSGGRAGPSPTGHSLPGHCVERQPVNTPPAEHTVVMDTLGPCSL